MDKHSKKYKFPKKKKKKKKIFTQKKKKSQISKLKNKNIEIVENSENNNESVTIAFKCYHLFNEMMKYLFDSITFPSQIEVFKTHIKEFFSMNNVWLRMVSISNSPKHFKENLFCRILRYINDNYLKYDHDNIGTAYQTSSSCKKFFFLFISNFFYLFQIFFFFF